MSTWTRRNFLAGASAALAASTLTRVNAAPPATTRPARNSIDESAYQWHDVRDWGIEGKGFSDTEGDYDRLPKRAKGIVRSAVWALSKDSTGLSVGFKAATPAIAIRYTLLSESIAMPHMCATGVSGADLYGQDASNNLRWIGDARPTSQHVSQSLAQEMDIVDREYRLYFPLYNGVKKLEIGLPHDIDLTPIAPRTTGAIVYYGTSIAQGGCVSRPGVAFTSSLSRRLDRPFINLAFSGNGKMEETVGRFLVELDPAAWVIDCVPNMTTEMVRQNTIPLVHQLRAVRPNTPILLVEDRINDTFWTSKHLLAEGVERRRALSDAYDTLLSTGQKNIHYLKGDNLIGTDGEGTVDGSHPNDLGTRRYTEQLEPAIKQMLA
ncbi:MAG TPA: SGNH/GDSL hydrolase family protein [Tepidisphaeraceae bacterium]|jgi:hypothetical protein|nr:SGNH/GDSL hydrolase family protein [Tepidisphaeraceae bacterium]